MDEDRVHVARARRRAHIMYATAVWQDDIGLLILLGRPQEDRVLMGCADAERARLEILSAVGSSEPNRDDVRNDQIGRFIDEQAGREIDRVATIATAIARRPTGSSRIVVAVDHGAGEFIQPRLGIGDDLHRVGRHRSQPVNVPIAPLGIVMKELHPLVGALAPIVRVDQLSAVRTAAAGGDVRPTRLNREVDRHLHVRREWERRTVHRNRGNPHTIDRFAVDAANDRVRRNVELEAWNRRRGHDNLARRRYWNRDLVPNVQPRHPDRKRQRVGPADTHRHAVLEEAVAPTTAIRRGSRDGQDVPASASGRCVQEETARAVAFDRRRTVHSERDARQRPTIERQHPSGNGGHAFRCNKRSERFPRRAGTAFDSRLAPNATTETRRTAPRRGRLQLMLGCTASVLENEVGFVLVTILKCVWEDECAFMRTGKTLNARK